MQITFCLALVQVFTFTHPEYSTTKDNQRYKKLQFEIPQDSGSVMVHGMRVQALSLLCVQKLFFFFLPWGKSA